MTKEYIDRWEFMEELTKLAKTADDATEAGIELAMLKLGEHREADVVEVKHGVWLYKLCVVFDSTKDLWRCSECNTSWDAESKYCPNCGAKMDGD